MIHESEATKKTDLPVQVFQELDHRDEEQILAEIRGELVEEFVYSIQLQGRQVTNLSYAGIKEAIRRRGNFEILDIQVTENDAEFRALVRVRDLINRIDVLGASTAEKNKPFAYVLALNKAERNAFSKLIPAKWYATLIDDWLKRRRESSRQNIQADNAVACANTSEEANNSWKTSVPITTEPITQEGLRQFPLIQGTQGFGMINILGDEASIVPEGPCYVSDPSIGNFLIGRILEQMKEKREEFQYQISEGNNGILDAILIKGPLQEGQIKDLVNAARWAFSKALGNN